jgi:hypothetical protein
MPARVTTSRRWVTTSGQTPPLIVEEALFQNTKKYWKEQNIAMGPDGGLYQERLCWRGPAASVKSLKGEKGRDEITLWRAEATVKSSWMINIRKELFHVEFQRVFPVVRKPCLTWVFCKRNEGCVIEWCNYVLGPSYQYASGILNSYWAVYVVFCVGFPVATSNAYEIEGK